MIILFSDLDPYSKDKDLKSTSPYLKVRINIFLIEDVEPVYFFSWGVVPNSGSLYDKKGREGRDQNDQNGQNSQNVNKKRNSNY